MAQLSIIIPSFDRPAQLDCLLRSLLQHWDYNDLDIKVLYRHSSMEFEEGYHKVFEKHWHVIPSLEYSFSEQVKQSIISSLSTVVGFFTDDCVVYTKPLISPILIKSHLEQYEEKYVTFSLRLGVNTIIQNYLTNETQPLLQYKEIDDINIIEWNWKRYSRLSNYGYWFSWDGHFYSKNLLTSEKVFSKYFGIHRDLEHQLISDTELYNSLPNKILSCKTSSVFVNTLNTVQTDGAIPAGTKYSYGVKELNDRFLAGEVISLRSFDNLELRSCHEEVPLIFEKE